MTYLQKCTNDSKPYVFKFFFLENQKVVNPGKCLIPFSIRKIIDKLNLMRHVMTAARYKDIIE